MSRKPRKKFKKYKQQKRRKATPLPTKAPFRITDDPLDLPVTFRKKLYKLMERGQHDIISECILELLLYYQKNNFRGLDQAARDRINEAVSAIFTIISDPDFVIAPKYAATYVARAHLFANLVALSCYETTDSILRQVMTQQNNIVKIFFLYSSRNHVELDPEKFFELQPNLASLWYFTYSLPTVGCVMPHQQANVRRHFENLNEAYIPADHRVAVPYFSCTYFAGKDRADRQVKEQINASCRKKLDAAGIKVKNTPARDSILVVTSKWFDNSAVYKSYFPFLDRFRGKYRMTLAHTGMHAPVSLATDYFDEVHRIRLHTNTGGINELSIRPIADNDFQLAFFPDVGMTDESVWLSNLRLAPIQVTGYGHPVSTFGSEIDYFVVGEETEKLDDLAKNYSETPIVLPGLGCVPTWPTYKPKYPEKKTDKVIANCIWGPDKYNYTMLRVLQEISSRASGLKYEIFASRGVHRYNAFLPFVGELSRQMGETATLHSDKEYMAYMEEAEYADFAINSYPFGGYNTVVESLFLGKPVVTLEGDRFYNMAASALLRRVGLGNLIAKTAPEFIELCARMCNDPAFLAEQQAKLAEVDLGKTLFYTDEPTYFARAMEHIIDNHGKLEAGKPIYAREL
jgi:hypothetical protein